MKVNLSFETRDIPFVMSGELVEITNKYVRLISDYSGSHVMYDFTDKDLKKVELIP